MKNRWAKHINTNQLWCLRSSRKLRKERLKEMVCIRFGKVEKNSIQSVSIILCPMYFTVYHVGICPCIEYTFMASKSDPHLAVMPCWPLCHDLTWELKMNEWMIFLWRASISNWPRSVLLRPVYKSVLALSCKDTLILGLCSRPFGVVTLMLLRSQNFSWITAHNCTRTSI